MALASSLIAVATKELSRGKLGAKIVPGSVHWNGNSTDSLYCDWYLWNGYWCAMFVSWCANQAGIPDTVIPYHGLTGDGVKWFKERGAWHTNMVDAKAGDIVYFNTGNPNTLVNHVGIVVAFADGGLYTIEGNTTSKALGEGQGTGGCVAQKHRGRVNPAMFVGFGRPVYSVTPGPPETTPPFISSPAEWDQTPDTPVTVSLAVDGYWGAATTRSLQRRFGTPIDGVISGQVKGSWNAAVSAAEWGTGGSTLIRAMQGWLGMTVDGYLGPQTIRALQGRMGTLVDGVISPGSLMVKEMQRRLNSNTL